MAHKDWDPDELLDFDFKKKPRQDESDVQSQRKQYEELRRARREEFEENRSFENNVERKVQKRKSKRSDEEIAAIRKANREANERYRSNYNKNVRRNNKRKASKFTKGLSVVYLAVLVAFAIVMMIMDVLPFKMMTALFIILGLLSFILTIQLRKSNIKKSVRVMASMLAVVLIGVYGVGMAYAVGTLSFLAETTVKNDSKVASITRDAFNVVITGMDTYGTIDEDGRSDVNMIVTVNPKTYQILMTSIPRDYEITLSDKDGAMDKLTHTGQFGIDTTIKAEEDLLGIKSNYYVKVNFSTVEKFIDAIGGVDVESDFEFNPTELEDWTVKEGMNHMNGEQALAFARERKAFALGDRQRIKDQQAVFEAILKKATSSRTMVLNYNSLLTELQDYFQMSISSREMRSLVKLQLSENPDWKIFKNTVNGGDGTLYTYSAGYAYVMTKDQGSVDNASNLINAVLNGQALDRDDDGNVIVVETTEEESK